MKLLEYLATGKLALIDVADEHVTKVEFPNLIRSASMSPGEEHLRVATMKKPFSYFVPVTAFGAQEGIWNLEGKSLYTLSDRNLRESRPQATAVAGLPAGQPAQAARGAGQRGGRGAAGRGRGPAQAPTQGGQPPADPGQPPADPGQPP